MADHYLGEYGIARTLDFELYTYTDAKDHRIDAVHASGDTKVSKDEGAAANTSNGFVDRGRFYSIQLTATEMTAKRIVLEIVDQDATKLWIDKTIIIETFGDANAQFPDRNDALADAILIRNLSNVESTAPVASLAAALMQLVSRVAFDDTNNLLKVYKLDGTTVMYQKSATQAASVQPITDLGVNT